MNQNKTESNNGQRQTDVASGAVLGIWWSSMPTWAKDAYHNCPTCNRVIKECAMAETTKAEMLWKLCAALYEQRNQWRETALYVKQYEPLIVKMPNASS